ncbi:hypothetical protein [Enhygromyxa salina]|uniref:Uncharacterized protein n=1 Tax=Enhygromyxa salina TaxID=215803 RepID=A0A2S9XQN0_9BACT|nr:hypothetical protein [Enhygromyxa salina]PRP95165.1 hypothetical protein ENSA7_74790 [Enhygromyxa salina]
MGIKKTFKKGKKAGKSVGKAADDAGKAVGKAVNEASDWTGKQVVKGYNATTGAIEGSLDTVVDYADDQYEAAVKYAEKTYNEGVDWLEDLAQDAIDAAFRAAYDSVAGDYAKLAAELLDVEIKLFAKPSNILTTIRDSLFVGKFSKAADDISELLELDIMKRALEIGHRLHGTSFIFGADLTLAASAPVGPQPVVTVGAGPTASIGITQMLDHEKSYEHSRCVFSSLGPALSLGGATSASKLGGSAEFGIIMGFVSKDPTNIGGWFVDVSGGGGLEHGVYSAGLSWSPPGSKPPYVKPKPVAVNLRVAITTSASPGGSISLGGSYTWLIQKVKNPLYIG